MSSYSRIYSLRDRIRLLTSAIDYTATGERKALLQAALVHLREAQRFYGELDNPVEAMLHESAAESILETRIGGGLPLAARLELKPSKPRGEN